MNDSVESTFPEPGESRIGSINKRGLWTLYVKESRRFTKVWLQTLAAPAITTILFMIIFSLAFGGENRSMKGLEYSTFLAPGLLVMAMLQNAFANTSSSILIGKVQGNIVDVLMPPLSNSELMIGFVAGGLTRALAVGGSVAIAFLLMPSVSLTVHHWWAILYFGVSAGIMLSLVGIITGIWAEKFDQAAVITNFVVAPLSLLSGTFYSIERLSGNWQLISQANPFFYMIDGFRYGFIGVGDSDLTIGVIYIFILNLFLWLLAHSLFKSGYKLKS
ncbi:ABC transporter permease [Temperatibacter marinus]|uniref:Transport permease protein n=1 Tax=Temperatibacter marinus TaxID=1456591 RepID=A0AA52EI72_9PROT|nr:ABC transporter permease [Temperatibacter marinus]WND03250.1 ABC transporter permease [Temperatibacter marinus]